MKNGIYFIVIAFLVAESLDFDLCKLEDLWHKNMDTKWCEITNPLNEHQEHITLP